MTIHHPSSIIKEVVFVDYSWIYIYDSFMGVWLLPISRAWMTQNPNPPYYL